MLFEETVIFGGAADCELESCGLEGCGLLAAFSTSKSYVASNEENPFFEPVILSVALPGLTRSR